MEEIPDGVLSVHDEDEVGECREALRIIICMSKSSSQRLLEAQYLQSDIAFKRVTGFLEFEIGGLDQNSRTGMILFDSACVKR